ncbi:iron ABC transporter permease [Serratia ureilytica]
MARLRTETFLRCALSTRFLVSLTGVIGFVGLMVPYLARRLVKRAPPIVRADVRHAGAMLLTGGDMLSRSPDLIIRNCPSASLRRGWGARSSCSVAARGAVNAALSQ